MKITPSLRELLEEERRLIAAIRFVTLRGAQIRREKAAEIERLTRINEDLKHQLRIATETRETREGGAQ